MRNRSIKGNLVNDLRLGDNAAAISLLSAWLEDISGYDEQVWPRVKESIEENSMRKQNLKRSELESLGIGVTIIFIAVVVWLAMYGGGMVRTPIQEKCQGFESQSFETIICSNCINFSEHNHQN